MESFYRRNSNKTLNESAAEAIKRYVVCAIQSKNQQNQHRRNPSFTFNAKKKLKRPWEQSWMEKRLLKLKHLLDEKNSPNDKNHLKPKDFSLLWKLANIETHL